MLLRQNPHNVEEWHKRVALFEDSPAKMVECYTQAVATIEPQLAQGKLSTLWIAFAKMYEERGDLAQARVVFDKGVCFYLPCFLSGFLSGFVRCLTSLPRPYYPVLEPVMLPC